MGKIRNQLDPGEGPKPTPRNPPVRRSAPASGVIVKIQGEAGVTRTDDVVQLSRVGDAYKRVAAYATTSLSHISVRIISKDEEHLHGLISRTRPLHISNPKPTPSPPSPSIPVPTEPKEPPFGTPPTIEGEITTSDNPTGRRTAQAEKEQS